MLAAELSFHLGYNLRVSALESPPFPPALIQWLTSPRKCLLKAILDKQLSRVKALCWGRALQNRAEHPSHAAHPCEPPKAPPSLLPARSGPKGWTQALLSAWPGGPWIAQVKLGLRRSSFIHPSFLQRRTQQQKPGTVLSPDSPLQPQIIPHHAPF